MLDGTTRNWKSGRGGADPQAVGVFRAALVLHVGQVQDSRCRRRAA